MSRKLERNKLRSVYGNRGLRNAWKKGYRVKYDFSKQHGHRKQVELV